MALSKNPEGSTEQTDSLGTFTVYNRSCKNCGIDLTSRNRATSGALNCKPCESTLAKSKYATTPRRLRTPQQEAALAIKRADPDRKFAHSLLEAFLNHPCNPNVRHQLIRKLDSLETAALMSRS